MEIYVTDFEHVYELNIKYKFIQFAISFTRRVPIYQGGI